MNANKCMRDRWHLKSFESYVNPFFLFPKPKIEEKTCEERIELCVYLL